MKLNIEEISVTLTLQEARVLKTLIQFVCDDDPYSEASKKLKMDINNVVQVGRKFEELLARVTIE